MTSSRHPTTQCGHLERVMRRTYCGYAARCVIVMMCVVAVNSGVHWSGRACCQLPLSSQCSHSCQRAKSIDDLSPQCRPGDEIAFFDCIERQRLSAQCCGSFTTSPCSAVCRAIFIQDSPPTDSQRRMVTDLCNVTVATCVHNFTTSAPSSSPIDSLPCCNHSSSEQCRIKCSQALRTLTNEEEIVEQVAAHCGVPSPTDSLWQCFLRSSTNNVRDRFNHGGSIELTGIDGAKLQCCVKAETEACRNLCERTFSSGWTSSVTFYNRCSYHPHELQLNMCLEEVEQPCALGCSGLTYCQNFNYRPTEMFRSCTSEADDLARNTMLLWSQGTISLPLLLPDPIPVQDISQCLPEVWKSVACTLQIKPCQQNIRATWICKSDCLALLHTCLDVTRLRDGMSAESICNRLSPNNPTQPCISLSTFQARSRHVMNHQEVTLPCSGSPCPPSDICLIDRRPCTSHHCTRHMCRAGCPMGELLSHVVPHNSYVTLPIVSRRQVNCERVCKCGHHSLLHKCQDMACVEEGHCMLDHGMYQEHSNEFELDCNLCVCHGGEVECTKRQCHSGEHEYTGLPCNCDSGYVPVCGHNGRTYPSACVARCLGLTDSQFEIGRCMAKDPCFSNPCAVGERCVARNRVCLSNRASNCHQFECVRLTEGCSRHQRSPVCDTNQDEIPSLCLLLSTNRELAHRGHCLVGCDLDSVACGMDGETYASQCAAWSVGVPIDYPGPCLAVGQLPSPRATEPRCYNVECPRPDITWPHCQPITAPGACCSICAGEIRVIYSQSQADRAGHVTKNGPITVENVREVLQQQLSVLECDVFVYISIESDLVILITPITKQPTPLQIEACMVETDKMAFLISSHSPTLMSHIAVSPFLSARVRKSTVNITTFSSAATASSSYSFLGLTLLLNYFAVCHLMCRVTWIQR